MAATVAPSSGWIGAALSAKVKAARKGRGNDFWRPTPHVIEESMPIMIAGP